MSSVKIASGKGLLVITVRVVERIINYFIALGLEKHDRPWHISSSNALTGEGNEVQPVIWVGKI